jgi:hypothetical protein
MTSQERAGPPLDLSSRPLPVPFTAIGRLVNKAVGRDRARESFMSLTLSSLGSAF